MVGREGLLQETYYTVYTKKYFCQVLFIEVLDKRKNHENRFSWFCFWVRTRRTLCPSLAAHPALARHVQPRAIVARAGNDDLPNAGLTIPDTAGRTLPAFPRPIGVLENRAVAAPTSHRSTRVGELLTLGRSDAQPKLAVAVGATGRETTEGCHDTAAEGQGDQENQRGEFHFVPF